MKIILKMFYFSVNEKCRRKKDVILIKTKLEQTQIYYFIILLFIIYYCNEFATL